MLYAHCIAGNPLASRFVYPYTGGAAEWAVAMLSNKLNAYLDFNQSYPGYGGFIPWFYANETKMRPTTDWENRVPALDNGCVLVAESTGYVFVDMKLGSSSGPSTLPSASSINPTQTNTDN